LTFLNQQFRNVSCQVLFFFSKTGRWPFLLHCSLYVSRANWIGAIVKCGTLLSAQKLGEGPNLLPKSPNSAEQHRQNKKTRRATVQLIRVWPRRSARNWWRHPPPPDREADRVFERQGQEAKTIIMTENSNDVGNSDTPTPITLRSSRSGPETEIQAPERL